jgi:acyl carrier protein
VEQLNLFADGQNLNLFVHIQDCRAIDGVPQTLRNIRGGEAMVLSAVSNDRIIHLLSERIHVEVPSADTDLMESGLLDSLTLVELMSSLEEQFGINISFDEVEIDNFRSARRIAEFVNQRSRPRAMAVSY